MLLMGTAGFLTLLKSREDNLDHMIAFDNKLIDGITALTTEIDAFKADLASGATSNLKTRVQNVTDKLESLENTFDQRNEVIMGVS